MSLPVIYTPEELATALKLDSDWWIREQIRRGRCEAVKVAGTWRLTEKQAADLIRLHTTTVTSQPDTIPARRRRAPESETPQEPEPEPELRARTPRRRRAA